MTNGVDVGSLIENRLLLQMLSGVGASIAGEDSFAAGINPIIQQNISSQSYAKLLSKLLEGGGKMTLDKDKVNITADPKLLQDDTEDIQSVLAGTRPKTPGLGTLARPTKDISISETIQSTRPQGGTTNFLGALLNPSASPLGELTGADLAGLTTQDISQALQLRLGTESLKQKTQADIRQSLLDQMRLGILGQQAETAEKRANIEAFKAMTKDERTAAQKNYAFAQTPEGGNFRGSFSDFQDIAKTTHEKDYEAAVEGGYKGTFHEWYRDIVALGGGLDLGERLDIKSEAYLTDPRGLAKDIDKFVESEDFQNRMFALGEQAETERPREIIKFIEGRITATGGTITDVELSDDGKIVTWSVTFPRGRKKEIKHAIRP